MKVNANETKVMIG